MLETEMIEKSSGRMEITDIEPSVLREMVHFIYTGKVCLFLQITLLINRLNGFKVLNLDSVALDLLKAANKYELDELMVFVPSKTQ